MAKAKRIKGINCNSAAGDGIKLALVTRFRELYVLREAALDWSDPEGVHSMRVASRRLRSALRDFMPYLRKRGLASVIKELKTLADALGQVRDQDVAIMVLENLESHAPAEISPALKEFIAEQKELREKARQELLSMLEQSRLQQLETDFMAAVEASTAARPQTQQQVTFLKMSRVIMLDLLRELEKLSNGLFKPLDTEALHELRIAAKRLRYAVELFQPCWGNSISTYAKRAARIQTALGDVHDCDVWIESFGKHINVARKSKRREDVAALVWLLDHFVKLRTKHLRQAFAHWSDWESQDTGGKLRTELRHQEPPETQSI
jgi:CHAD domain-containing protein